jgi:hypothetical protein
VVTETATFSAAIGMGAADENRRKRPAIFNVDDGTLGRDVDIFQWMDTKW